MSWVDGAACAGMPHDLWFSAIPAYESRARFVCSLCPVTAACLADALEVGDKFSLRAGTTPWERRQMKREAA